PLSERTPDRAGMPISRPILDVRLLARVRRTGGPIFKANTFRVTHSRRTRRAHADAFSTGGDSATRLDLLDGLSHDEIGIGDLEQALRLMGNRVGALDMAQPPLDGQQVRARLEPEEAAGTGLRIERALGALRQPKRVRGRLEIATLLEDSREGVERDEH